MKNIQISQKLFVALVKYHLLEIGGEEDMIKKELTIKMNSITKRQIYSKYKAANSEEQREKARQEYLEKVGIPEAFRW